MIGSSDAPYLNGLIPQGELFADYAAVASGSNPNYLGMTSGLTSALSPPSPNIFQAIDGTGGALTWKEFMESEPGNCGNGNGPNIPGTSVPLYSSDHDPAYAYQSNTTCNANDVPLGVDSVSPFAMSWSPVAEGDYTLTAVATDNKGATATSTRVLVTVKKPNVPPTVSLTSPGGGASFVAPATVPVSGMTPSR